MILPIKNQVKKGVVERFWGKGKKASMQILAVSLISKNNEGREEKKIGQVLVSFFKSPFTWQSEKMASLAGTIQQNNSHTTFLELKTC